MSASNVVIDFREELFRRDIAAVNALGSERVWLELLSELGAQRMIRSEIEALVRRYARRLNRETLVALGADQMPPPR